MSTLRRLLSNEVFMAFASALHSAVWIEALGLRAEVWTEFSSGQIEAVPTERPCSVLLQSVKILRASSLSKVSEKVNQAVLRSSAVSRIGYPQESMS